VLHDLAITIRRLQAEKRVKRVMVVDLDFHQGDGTALIFKDDPDVFTFSVHSQEGWPDRKAVSDLDVPIRRERNISIWKKLNSVWAKAMRRFSPDLVLYVAGSDPYEK